MHRCETITSEEGDKKEEVEHLRAALRVCGYPSWALNKTESISLEERVDSYPEEEKNKVTDKKNKK